MFTGLIQKTGKVVALERSGGSGGLRLKTTTWDPPVRRGDSIAVQGVCLTLTGQERDELHFDILNETFERTSLGDKRVGDTLNLERSLRYGDELGGHIVSGHVDGVGTVMQVTQVARSDREVRIACEPARLTEMVPKGSVACDGISLTIVDVSDDSFTVHIIPHTWSHTSFHGLTTGAQVNLETDVLAKYARAALRQEGKSQELSWETLRALGAD